MFAILVKKDQKFLQSQIRDGLYMLAIKYLITFINDIASISGPIIYMIASTFSPCCDRDCKHLVPIISLIARIFDPCHQNYCNHMWSITIDLNNFLILF